MLTTEKIQENVIDLVSIQGGVRKENITLDSKIEECNMDSIDFAELCMYLEDEYDITIGNMGKVSRSEVGYRVSEPSTSESLTVEGIVKYVQARVN